MRTDIRRARRALTSAGARSAALYWPFGRERRAHLLLRRRLAVLEAKNAVADLLFRRQKPLTDATLRSGEAPSLRSTSLRLSTVADVERALGDPEKRKLVVALSVSREVIEEELQRRPGTELGRALDQALFELIRDGLVLEVPGKALLMREDVFVAAMSKPQPHYDVSELNRLLREGTSYATQLRARARREDTTTVSRSYRL
jgi:hypothetical protein